jgi:hypothetical protein
MYHRLDAFVRVRTYVQYASGAALLSATFGDWKGY